MKKFLSLLAMAAFVIACPAQLPTKAWQIFYSYDSESNETNVALRIDANGNIYQLIGSENYLGGIAYSHPVIRKLDASGNQVWTYVYTNNGTYNTHFTTMDIDAAGNVYVGGYETIGTQNPSFFAVIAKLDANGLLSWKKTFDGTLVESRAQQVLCDTSINVYVSGYTIDTGFHGVQLLEKLDSAGNIVWQKPYLCLSYWNTGSLFFNSNKDIISGCSDSLIAFSANDGSVLWASDTSRFIYNGPVIALDKQDNVLTLSWMGNNYELQKLNPQGDVLWTIDSLNHAAGFGDWQMQLLIDDNNDIYASGVNQGWTNDTPHVYKISEQGIVLWDAMLAYDPVASVFSHGHLFTAGNAISWSNYTTAIYRINPMDGNTDWMITEGDSINNRYADLLEADAAGNLIFASRHSASDGYNNVAVAKYVSTLAVPKIEGVNETLKVYPNPGKGIFNISLTEGLIGEIMQLTDIQGKILFEQKMAAQQQHIDMRDFANGMYFIKVGNAVSRLIKQ